MSKTTLAEALALTITENGAVCRKCDFTLAADRVKQETARTAQMLANQVSLPGFRRGKAPVAMIVKRFGDDLKNELRRQILGAAFSRLNDAEKLDVVYCRMPDEAKLELDKDFTFSLAIDVAPAIKDVEYKGIPVTAAEVTVDDKELDERVAQYRKMYAEFEEVSGPAVADDMLKVDYTSDFVLPEDASKTLERQVKAEGNYLWLSEPEYLPGSAKALIGAEAGKEYDLKSEYPADYREAALAGKTVNYKVKVVSVQRRKELDDAALAAKMQLKDVAELRNMLKQGMQREADGKRKEAIREAVYAELEKMVGDFELPPTLLEAETEQALQMMAREAVKSEADAEAFKKDLDAKRAEAKVEAVKKLRRNLIFRKIAKLENITVSAQEVDREIANLSRYYGYKPAELRANMERNGAIEELQNEIQNGKVWDFLADQAKVSAK